jgi:Dolichyl-phosphate-mannose-protein mannosyltransferase
MPADADRNGMDPRPAAVLEVDPETWPEAYSRAFEPPRRRVIRPRPVLVALFFVAATAHALASLAHVTPAIFTDELLHSKLAQSFAAGDPFSIRGERFLFPAPLPALLQAPAWLFGSVPVGYELAKILNAVVMSSAVFPAYWLARRFTRPSWALVAAGLAVAAPAMLYHAYLLSEALAYPVFPLAAAVMVRALDTPSRRWGVAVIGVSLLAIATRTQFAVLPAAFALATLVEGRRALRFHALPLAVFAVLGGIVVASRGAALGPYESAQELEYGVGSVLEWAGATGMLLPFAAGLVVVPGAVLGLVLLLGSRADRAAGVFVAAVGLLVLLAAGVVAAGDADRPLERYVIYLPPLAAILFFAYAERGAPWRRVYLALAVVLGLGAWAVPYGTLADFRFSFDSPTLSAYGTLASWFGHANASTVFAGAAFFAAALVATVRLRTRAAPFVALASLVPLVFLTTVAYVGDHGMTQSASRSWSAEPADWIDRAGLGRADFLVLPYDPPYFAWTAEAWNRDFGRPLRLGVETPRTDPFAAGEASIRSDGVLLADGEPAGAGVIVVNDFGSRIDLEGDVVAGPRGGLRAVRVPEAPQVRSLAEGLYFDGWAAPRLRYSVWPAAPGGGRYVVGLALPEGMPAREFTVSVGEETRVLRLEPGERTELVVPVAPGEGLVPPLRMQSDGGEIADGRTANPRIVAARVVELRFEPSALGVSS